MSLKDVGPVVLVGAGKMGLALARGWAVRPDILFLDEPTANLDARGRRRFIELVRSLPATKLIATHDLEMVLELCPRTLLLDGGQVIANGQGLFEEPLGLSNLLSPRLLVGPFAPGLFPERLNALCAQRASRGQQHEDGN